MLRPRIARRRSELKSHGGFMFGASFTSGATGPLGARSRPCSSAEKHLEFGAAIGPSGLPVRCREWWRTQRDAHKRLGGPILAKHEGSVSAPAHQTTDRRPTVRRLGGLGVLRGVLGGIRCSRGGERGPVALRPRLSPGVPLSWRTATNSGSIPWLSSGT